MDPQQWLQNYQARIDGYRRASEELKENLGNAVVTLRSPDESVEVTVGPNGSLKSLQLSPRASEHSPQQLGALIMKTVARAQRAVAEQVIEAFAPLGANGNAMKLLSNYLPDDPDEQDSGQPSAYGEDISVDPYAVPAARPSMPAVPAPVARPRATRAADIDDDDFGGDPW